MSRISLINWTISGIAWYWKEVYQGMGKGTVGSSTRPRSWLRRASEGTSDCKGLGQLALLPLPTFSFPLPHVTLTAHRGCSQPLVHEERGKVGVWSMAPHDLGAGCTLIPLHPGACQAQPCPTACAQCALPPGVPFFQVCPSAGVSSPRCALPQVYLSPGVSFPQMCSSPRAHMAPSPSLGLCSAIAVS